MSKITKFVFASDNHGELGDQNALSALYEYCRDFKPDVRIGGGDHFDCASVRKGAMGEMEGVRSMKADLDAGRHFFARFRPTHVLNGNHEYRLEKLGRSHTSGNVRDYCLDKYRDIKSWARAAGAKVVLDYRRDSALRIGPITAHHGIGSDLGKMGMFYCREGGLFLCGHGHHGHQVNLPKLGRGAAYMAPALADLEALEYSENTLSAAKHNNGWVAGWYNDAGEWRAWIINRLGNGKWCWQTEIKVFDPKSKNK
jgi:hypothetical protein